MQSTNWAPVFIEDIQSLTLEDALSQAKEQLWYHTIDITPEYHTEGVFDLRDVVSEYGFPSNLTGKRILDIGRSSGFFAFEFEKRNAETVVATELPSLTDKNFVGGDITSGLISEWLRWKGRSGWQNVSESGRRLDFYLAHKLLGSKVIPVDACVEEVDILGSFDLVFVGSLLNHVRDIGGALQSIRRATADLCVIANPVLLDDSDEPRIAFAGVKSPGLTTWFLPNVQALVNLVEAAGFADVRVRNPALGLPYKNKTMPHAIIHARRGSDSDVRQKFARYLANYYPGIERMVEETV